MSSVNAPASNARHRSGFYSRVSTAAITDPNLSDRALRVLAYYGSHAHGTTDLTQVGERRAAEALGMTRYELRVALEELISAGHLISTGQHGVVGRKGLTYFIPGLKRSTPKRPSRPLQGPEAEDVLLEREHRAGVHDSPRRACPLCPPEKRLTPSTPVQPFRKEKRLKIRKKRLTAPYQIQPEQALQPRQVAEGEETGTEFDTFEDYFTETKVAG